MPKFTLTDDQIADVAAFVHTFRAAGYDESRVKPPSIVVGDAKAGETFFGANAASCHSATGDLRGLATKIADPRLLQQTWLLPGSGAGRGGPPPVQVKPTTVTVTLPSGEKVEGTLDRVDDFVVALTQADGTRRSFSTNGDTPKVEIHDPLQPHKDLLKVYSDTDIHNVTAYLVTRNETLEAKLSCARKLGLRPLRAFAFPSSRRAAAGSIPRTLLKPLADSWTSYSGDYTGRRYSALTQVNQANVKNLTLAFAAKVTGGPGGGGGRGGPNPDGPQTLHRR